MNTKTLTTANFSFSYENQHPSVKANIINRAIARVAVECSSIDELLERYEADILPEYNDFIRSTYTLLPTHLPLCMLHDVKTHLSKDADALSDYDGACEFLTNVCIDTFPLKEA